MPWHWVWISHVHWVYHWCIYRFFTGLLEPIYLFPISQHLSHYYFFWLLLPFLPFLVRKSWTYSHCGWYKDGELWCSLIRPGMGGTQTTPVQLPGQLPAWSQHSRPLQPFGSLDSSCCHLPQNFYNQIPSTWNSLTSELNLNIPPSGRFHEPLRKVQVSTNPINLLHNTTIVILPSFFLV